MPGLGRSFPARTPEEADVPAIRLGMEKVRPAYQAVCDKAPSIIDIVADPIWRVRHLAIVDRMAPRPRGRVDPTSALVSAKISEAITINEAVGFLDSKERATLIATPHLLESLAYKPLAGDAKAG